MKSNQLLEGLEFHEPIPFAQPILVDQNSRILRWMLKPNQQIEEHKVPGSPFYVVVLQGHGIFAGGDGQEQEFGPGSLLIFEPDEPHTVQALNEELVFVSFLQGTDQMRAERTGGELGRK